MHQTKKVELLAPAGNFEKLEIAIHYGADAVYLAGKDFSLRNFSGNFTIEEMEKAVNLAHENNVKVYVACNIYSRNNEQDSIKTYLSQLKEIKPDALIIADPGMFMQAKITAPEIPIHISTQSNSTNYNIARFWKDQGASRINTARELPLNEIKEISEKSNIEIESFVHGAMCISYSGRCLLSSYMTNRDSNRGLCSHPCRYKYSVVEEKRPGQYYPLMEDGRGAYIFNSRDLCMIEHIPPMINAGIDSLKIEGRMKGINYLASALKVYREAIDSFYEGPKKYKVKQEWLQELGKISHREYCTGFYFGDPEQVTPNYNKCAYSPEHIFAGKVIKNISENRAKIQARNKLCTGDRIEIISPDRPLVQDTIKEIIDKDSRNIPVAQPNAIADIVINTTCSANDLIRKIQGTP